MINAYIKNRFATDSRSFRIAPLALLAVAAVLAAGCGPSVRPPAQGPLPTNVTGPAPGPPLEAATNIVMLGVDDLTSGIPGEGLLSVEQITAWLADDANHEELQIDLPLGMKAGIGQMKGLEENPLTRAKIELGRQLYFDTRLSSDGTISCASCHDPAHGYAKETQFGVGVGGQEGNRNSPVAYNRILSDAQFWDGRAGSLEDQAIGPIQNPIEMANTHEVAVNTLESIEGYRLQFEKIFGEVSIEAVGKAIASFERALVTQPSPMDYWEAYKPYTAEGFDPEVLKEEDPDGYAIYEAVKEDYEAHPVSESAKRGRELAFGKAQCTTCHVGANLADEKYHNLGIGMAAEEPDLGRFKVTGEDKDRGAFKTPTLRNVALTVPYMHDGSLKTLEEVIDWYDKGGHPNAHLSDKIKKLNLTDQEKQDLVAYLKALTAPFPKVETGRLPQ